MYVCKRYNVFKCKMIKIIIKGLFFYFIKKERKEICDKFVVIIFIWNKYIISFGLNGEILISCRIL